MTSPQRKHVIELFVRSDRKARELVNRVFRMGLQDCVVVLRRLSPRSASQGHPLLTVNGEPLQEDADGRIGTAILRRAVAKQAVG